MKYIQKKPKSIPLIWATVGLSLTTTHWCTPLTYADPPPHHFPDISTLPNTPITQKMRTGDTLGNPALNVWTSEGIACGIYIGGGMGCQSHNPIFLPPDKKPKPGQPCRFYSIALSYINNDSVGEGIGFGEDLTCTQDPIDPDYLLPVNHKITFNGVTCAKLPNHTLACTNGKHQLVMEPNDIWTT